jgi:hypothetical protein
MRPKDVVRTLRKLIPLRMPVMLWGSPGIGKTYMVKQTAEELDYNLIVSHPITDDPTDYKGLPFAVEINGIRQATFLPFGHFMHALDASRPTIWFFDDMGHGVPAVQAAAMQLIEERAINGNKLPDTLTFVAASNRSNDRAGVHKMITPLSNRFGCHIDVEVSVKDWQAWAVRAGIVPQSRAFINFRPELLDNFKPERGDRAFASPRSWHKMSTILGAGMDEDLLPQVASGCIGTGPAAEFLAFLPRYLELPPLLDGAFANPETCTIPDTKPDIMFALCGALVERIRGNKGPVEAFAKYAARFQPAYATVAFRDGMAVNTGLLGDVTAQGWLREHREMLID